VTTLQTEYTADELLADHATSEPLLAGGVRCHGGFDGDGNYVSPRTKHRVPGIEAWQRQHVEDFGRDIIDVPLETWPEHFPNLAQARYLIEAGVREPLIGTLTRIGTVEGFGANIRYLQPGDMQRHFDESIKGTAIDHLGRGLFEAHGRDEAGWEPNPGQFVAGHKDMWFAARDIAFEHPTAKVDIEGMLLRMGFGQGNGGGSGGGGGGNGNGNGSSVLDRLLPDDVDPNLELVAALMTRVLFIEIQAFHTFAWAEAWLSDPALVAGDGEAARLVGYIRADETPHVGYLKTALTEMRDRTWVGASGRTYSGEEMVGRIWDRALDQSLGAGRHQNRKAVLGEVEHWCGQRPNGKEILEQFHALGTLEDATR
jgi:predicted heme/steroid binding protein